MIPSNETTLAARLATVLSALALGLATSMAYRWAQRRRIAAPARTLEESGDAGIGHPSARSTRHSPAATEHVDRRNRPDHAEQRSPRPRAAGPVETLIAEDNDVNALVLTRQLEKLGCRITRTTTGVDAVTAAGERGFEIVFLDWRMPEMDGLEAIRHIRRIEGYADVPIVAVTANAVTGDRETCLRAGADEYLTKPVDATALRATLERFGLAAEPVTTSDRADS